jgi:hypothetical protein
VTRIAVMIAGAIAMVVGATTTSWWVITHTESLGLRGARLCMGDGCGMLDYGDRTFAMLGSLAFYGAFVIAASSIVAAVSRRAGWIAAAASVVMLAIAISFMAERPDTLNFGNAFQKTRVFARTFTIGWSAVAYLAGAVAAAVGGVLVALDQNSRRWKLRA